MPSGGQLVTYVDYPMEMIGHQLVLYDLYILACSVKHLFLNIVEQSDYSRSQTGRHDVSRVSRIALYLP